MKLTVAYLTDQSGGIDLLADSLVTQTPVEGLDWDLVVIDDHPGRVERGLAKAYLKDRGLPLTHYGPSLDLRKGYGHAAAINTAVMHCNGDLVFFALPGMWLTPEVVGSWARAYELQKDPTHVIMHGIGIEYETFPPSDDDIVSWPQRSGDPRDWWSPIRPWVQTEFNLGFWCIPVRFFDHTNGLDPKSHAIRGGVLSNIKALAEHHGYEFFLERRIICHASVNPSRSSWLEEPDTGLLNWSPWSPNPWNMSEVRRTGVEPVLKIERILKGA